MSPNLEVDLDSISRDTTCDGAATTSDASLQSNYLKLVRYVAENVLKAPLEKLPFEKNVRYKPGRKLFKLYGTV